MNQVTPENDTNPNIGEIIMWDKDVLNYKRIPVWHGTYYDFTTENKVSPTKAIKDQLNTNLEFAYRAISGEELDTIVKGGGIGGQDYKGSVVEDGTLFDVNLNGAPLSMLDGRTYGGSGDRSLGGYLLVIDTGLVKSYSQESQVNDTVLKVTAKIPLEKLYALFRVEIKEPTLKTSDDIQKTYEISKIVHK